jgi:hypothetical protein
LPFLGQPGGMSVLFRSSPGWKRVISMFPASTLFVTLVFELTHPSGDFFDYDEWVWLYI